MDEIKNGSMLDKYKNIFGNTKDTINAIQKFINESSEIECTGGEMFGNGLSGNGIPGNGIPGNGIPGNGIAGNGLSGNGMGGNGCEYTDSTEAISRILESIADEETNTEIQKIIDNL